MGQRTDLDLPILKSVGIYGFLGNRELLRDSVWDAGGVLKSFVQVWWDEFGDVYPPREAASICWPNRMSPTLYIDWFSGAGTV